MSTDTKYCLCCGEEVPYNRIEREGGHELTCVNCGFVLDVEAKRVSGAAQYVITADDSQLIRDVLKAMLESKGLARTVIATENGQEFIRAFNRAIADRQSVDLVILDLEMPVLDGIGAARMMRSVEEKMKVKPTPILFFSGRKCDENLKSQLSLFAPASYVNKGGSEDPSDLAERIDQLVAHLLSKTN
jgi:CheY-like chemotaxis protein